MGIILAIGAMVLLNYLLGLNSSRLIGSRYYVWCSEKTYSETAVYYKSKLSYHESAEKVDRMHGAAYYVGNLHPSDTAGDKKVSELTEI